MDERRLLDAVFGDEGTRRAAREELSSAPRGALSLRLIEARLDRAAAELRDETGWSKARERSFVQRVLASTTRSEAAPSGNGRRSHRGSRVAGLVAACAAMLLAVLLVVARNVGRNEPQATVASVPFSPATQPSATDSPAVSSAGVEDVLSHARSQLVATGDSTSTACRTGRVSGSRCGSRL